MIAMMRAPNASDPEWKLTNQTERGGGKGREGKGKGREGRKGEGGEVEGKKAGGKKGGGEATC